MVNRVILIGHVGQVPEIIDLEHDKKIAKISLATSKSWKDRNGEKQERTEWHNIVVYGKLSEVVQKFVHKGDKLYIEGEIQYSTSEKDGEKKYFTNIVCNLLNMLGSKNSKTEQ